MGWHLYPALQGASEAVLNSPNLAWFMSYIGSDAVTKMLTKQHTGKCKEVNQFEEVGEEEKNQVRSRPGECEEGGGKALEME